jgi:hypothetical protein
VPRTGDSRVADEHNVEALMARHELGRQRAIAGRTAYGFSGPAVI